MDKRDSFYKKYIENDEIWEEIDNANHSLESTAEGSENNLEVTFEIRDDEDLVICLIDTPCLMSDQHDQDSEPDFSSIDDLEHISDEIEQVIRSEHNDSMTSSFPDKIVQPEISTSEQVKSAKKTKITDYYPKKKAELDQYNNLVENPHAEMQTYSEHESPSVIHKELKVLYEKTTEITLSRSRILSNRSNEFSLSTNEKAYFNLNLPNDIRSQTRINPYSAKYEKNEGVQPDRSNQVVASTQTDVSTDFPTKQTRLAREATAVQADCNEQVSLQKEKTSEPVLVETRHDSFVNDKFNLAIENDQTLANTNIENDKNVVIELDNVKKDQDTSGISRPVYSDKLQEKPIGMITDQESEKIKAGCLEEPSGNKRDSVKNKDQENGMIIANILEDILDNVLYSDKINVLVTEVAKADILDGKKIDPDQVIKTDIVEETLGKKHDSIEITDEATEAIKADTVDKTVDPTEITVQETQVTKSETTGSILEMEETESSKLDSAEYNDNILTKTVENMPSKPDSKILPNKQASDDVELEVDYRSDVPAPNQIRPDVQIKETEKEETTDQGTSDKTPNTKSNNIWRALKWFGCIAGTILVAGGLFSSYPKMENYCPCSAEVEPVKVAETSHTSLILPLLAIAPAVVLGQMFNHLLHSQEPFSRQQKMLTLLAFIHLVAMAIWGFAT